MPLLYARTLLPLTFLPPAGHWRDTTRNARFVLDPRPLPDPEDAAALVLTRYLEAFGPASKQATSPPGPGVAQREFPWHARGDRLLPRREGRELLDLPDRPLPPADTHLPPRFLGNWDQPLLAYADRDRIIPPEIQPLKLTLSGDCTVTVDGRVAASWRMDGPKLLIKPHTDFDHDAVARRGAPDRALLRASTARWRSSEPPARRQGRDRPPLRRAARHRRRSPAPRSPRRRTSSAPSSASSARRRTATCSAAGSSAPPTCCARPTSPSPRSRSTSASEHRLVHDRLQGRHGRDADRLPRPPPRRPAADDPRLLHADVDAQEQFSGSRRARATSVGP